MSKDVIIAGAIAVGCIALIAVAFIAPKSKSSTEAETPKTETTTTITDPGLGTTSSGQGTGGLDPLNPTGLGTTGGISTLPPIGSTGGLTGPANTGLPPSASTGFGTTGAGTAGLSTGFGTTAGNSTSGFTTGGATGGFQTQLPGPVTSPTIPEPPAAAVSETKTHTVVAGELLGDIALKYYKSSKQWKKIAEANPGLDPKNLKVGQKLVIPGVEAKPAETAAVTAGPGERTYTIKSGDSLYSVAKKELGSASRWKEIEKLNNISSNELHVGQVIKLPAAAAAVTPTDTAAPTTGGKTHTVAKGETLGDISKKYYGTTKNWKKIVEANPGTSPEGLKVGQKLVIPEAAGSTTAPAGGVEAAPAAGDYVIKAGDTLGSIAQKELGSKHKWKELQDANPGLDPRNLRAGQKIKIPGKKSEAPAPAPLSPAPAPIPAPTPFGTPAPTPFGAPAAPGTHASQGNPANDPTFASPYGGANFGQPAQPFGQTGPGFSQTGPAPGASTPAAGANNNGFGTPAEPFPGSPSPFNAPSTPTTPAEPTLR